MNEALLLSSVRQHELADAVEKANAVLRESERRFREMVDALPSAVYATDAEGRITHFNQACVALCGGTPQLGTDRWCVSWKMYCADGRLLSPEDCALALAVREGRVVPREEFMVERPDGTRRWVEPYPTPLLDAEGKVVGGINMLVDITERKQAEEARARLAAIVESSEDAILSKDLQGTITSWNEGAQRLFGYTAREAIGQPGAMLIPPDRRQEEHAMLLRLQHGERLAPYESVRVRKDGSSFAVSLTSSPVKDVGGHIVGVSRVVRDITDRKRAEAAIETQNQRLHLLWEAARVLLSTDDAGTMLHSLLSKIGPQLGVDTYLNYMVDKSGGALRLVSSEGIPAEVARSLERSEFGQAISGTEALPLRPIVANHIQQSDDPKAELVKSLGIHAYACNPLVADNRLLGTLSFASRSKDRFAADELAFLETISNYVAAAYARLRAQDAVRDSEHRLRFMMDSMPQKVFTAKPSGDIGYFNPQWFEFTGLSFEQIKDWGWKQFIHPDDVDENVRVWQLAIDTGQPFQLEHRFRRADGEYRWHFSRAMPMRDEAGRIAMWVGSTTDVQDIKRVEAALRDSEVRYRRLFEAAKDGILILDSASGEIVDANPFMTDLLGYSHDDFVGKELWQIGLFHDKAANDAAVRDLQDRGHFRHEHLPLESTQGRRVHVEVVANAYREGSLRVIQCNIRDVTERRRLEKQMQEQATQLSDLHRRKDEFLAMLSHELRNPLAAIASAVQLLGLQQSSENRIQQQARGIIERQVGQLGHLVGDLLDVSRITTGRVQLRREWVAIGGIVERAVETVRPMVALRRHGLTVSLGRAPIWVYADSARLEQVLVNLLTNAAKYTEDGGQVSLIVRREADECVLAVRDTGVGIAPELLANVFDLFTQADRSLDRSQGGLGIGLALVKQLTALHGGTVVVHSKLGQGSEFVVRLPAAPVDAPEPPLAATRSIEPTIRTLRVLVVDDNLDAALSLRMLLETLGHEVQAVHDGPATLPAALAFRPHVVLLDIGLPTMNGYDVARQLRQNPVLDDVVIVALTGYGDDADVRRSQAAGIDHHLVKPAAFDTLQKILVSVSAKLP